MQYFDKNKIDKLLSYEDLVDVIEKGFNEPPNVPPRLHYSVNNPLNNSENTLQIMPAWQEGKQLGIKLITVAPKNKEYNLETINGLYLLFDSVTGLPEAIMDAKAITNWRTACASALASKYLSRPDSQTLFMIGTGSLAPYLIKAHSAVRPIKKVLIWGRNIKKAEQIQKIINNPAIEVEVVENIEKGIKKADIISCATLSETPLIFGESLLIGQHIDLVGAYTPTMREANDEVLLRSDIYVDNIEMAPKETGDLSIPLLEGTIKLEDIKGDLFDLCSGKIEGRSSGDSITVFKSVGHALEDLVTAQLIVEKQRVKSTNSMSLLTPERFCN